MDKEEARFVLRCFRPDGGDAGDNDFAEALQWAASDRELGEWLARERAQDAEFSAALGRLTLPDGLREEILAGIAAEQGQELDLDAYDGQMIGALALVSPPDGFRNQILAAMERSVVSPTASKRSSGWWKFGAPIAAAAGIMFAVVLTRPNDPGNPGPGEEGPPAFVPSVPISHVESEAIATLSAPGFSLQLEDQDQKVLFDFIRKQGRACPQGALPKGLEGIPGIGCRTLDVEGKGGAIICFRVDGKNVVHLVVFRKTDVDCCDLPENQRPELVQQGPWAIARWQDAGRVFLLFGHSKTDELDDLF